MFDRKACMKEYYRNHKDEIKEYKKEYYQENKEQHNEKTKEWRKNHPGRWKEYNKEWVKNNLKRHKEIHLKASRKHKEKYPLRHKAQNYITHAVEARKIPPAREFKCEECGEQAQEYHHYKGYEEENWLDVIPLCRKCHGIPHLEAKAVALMDKRFKHIKGKQLEIVELAKEKGSITIHEVNLYFHNKKYARGVIERLVGLKILKVGSGEKLDFVKGR